LHAPSLPSRTANCIEVKKLTKNEGVKPRRRELLGLKK